MTIQTRKPPKELRVIERRMLECDPEPAHARQVCSLCDRLFDLFQAQHAQKPAARKLLLAAALLHDIGYSISGNAHHKHARDLIMSWDLEGYTQTERRIIACLTRYHRGPAPKPEHKVYRKLSPKRQETVQRLAALLRIADGLDRSHAASVSGLSLEPRRQGWILRVAQRTPNLLDIQGAIRKARLFTEIFETHLDIANGPA